MSFLDFIPGGRTVQILVMLALAASVIGGVTYAVHSYNESLRAEGRAEVQAKWDADVNRQKDAAIAQAATNAKETQRRLERQGDAQREQAKELERYQHVAADAVASRDGLRRHLAELAAAARAAASDTATADERKAGAAAAGVLADVSGGADSLAELYARQADSSRRAGLLCERSYDSLTPKANP